MYRFAEFFAGGGMVRAALSPDWTVALANDIDPKKCHSYRENWGDSELVVGDIAKLDPKSLYQPIDLYWASSPCQDLSLAGQGKGLRGSRSGVFYEWVKLIRIASGQGFSPRVLVFENVRGLLTRNAGIDFISVLKEFSTLGYRFGALELDARFFLPQSRPRIFIVAVRSDVDIPHSCLSSCPIEPFHGQNLRNVVDSMSAELRAQWIWWNIPMPDHKAIKLSDVLSENGDWFGAEKVQALCAMMDERSIERIVSLRLSGGKHFGTIYKRGRPDFNGKIRQRAEVRFDGLAGCLRTPAGGSSRQTVVFVNEGRVQMRLLTPREAMRLMGVEDDYKLPVSFNDGYKLAGDGVAVPVVAHLKTHLLEKIVSSALASAAA
jgi:DNA (cytosine-5)-methyltransferase 1